MSDQYHIPVMVTEVLKYLGVVNDGIYVDCTLGGGGHSQAILSEGGSVIGFDRDRDAVAYSEKRLSKYGNLFNARVARFSGLADMVGDNAGRIKGIIMDLGVSSRMIDEPSRGFSYRLDGPLKMTMDTGGETAFDIVNRKSIPELTDIFKQYGQERNAARIARAIDDARLVKPIETTLQLADIIEKNVSSHKPQKSKARIFQALRIYINDEIGELRKGLEGAVRVLEPGGRLCVITYHSLEDREVKMFMRTKADPCICPSDLPVCSCGLSPELRILTRKSLKPSPEEINGNSRARSAALRVSEKMGEA
ncbi:Ribosomal RNA small subunit methyltransferase H [subsurface metagenome]